MKTNHPEVYSHDNDVDLSHKINSIELNNWITHLQYTKNELNHLIVISNAILNGKFVNDFEEKHSENYDLLNVLNNYKRSRGSITECEDTHCDMAFITGHENFRKSYMYYLEKYRKLKNSFFMEVTSKITLK